MPIITDDMVTRALSIAQPTVELLLKEPENTWGPGWVEGWIHVPRLEYNIPFAFGKITDWNPVWGEKRDFSSVALTKMRLAHRLGKDTGDIVATEPWQLQSGEFLYPGGITYRGISVGTSGAMGWVDEAISNIIMSIIVMLAKFEADRRKAAHEMRI